jgi:hypothetical protein
VFAGHHHGRVRARSDQNGVNCGLAAARVRAASYLGRARWVGVFRQEGEGSRLRKQELSDRSIGAASGLGKNTVMAMVEHANVCCAVVVQDATSAEFR